MGIRDHAAKSSSSDSNSSGNWIKHGKGTFIVKRLKFNEGYKGDSFAAEFIVEESSPLVGELDEKGTQVLPNAPGSVVSNVQTFAGDKNKVDMAHKNMGIFIYALLGATAVDMAEAAASTSAMFAAEGRELPLQPDGSRRWTLDDEFANLCEYLTCEDIKKSKVVKTSLTPNGQDKVNPACGMRIGYSTVTATTKAQKKIVVPVWQSIEQTNEQIAAGRAQVEGKAAA